MAKNPEHKKFMAQYDELTDQRFKRMHGVENPEAKNRASWATRRKERRMHGFQEVDKGESGKAIETNPYDGATVTLRDSRPDDEIRKGLVDEKSLPPSISLEEAWEKAKSRGKKSK